MASAACDDDETTSDPDMSRDWTRLDRQRDRIGGAGADGQSGELTVPNGL